MAGGIGKAFRARGVRAALEEIANFLNRDLIPVFTLVRDEVNLLSGNAQPGEYRVPFFAHDVLQPSAASATWGDMDTESGITRTPRCWFDAAQFPDNHLGLERSVYVEYVLSTDSTPITNDPQVRLYNETDSAAVDGSYQAHDGTTAARYVVGPLALGDGPRLYSVQAAHADATAIIRLHSASFVVRYADG